MKNKLLLPALFLMVAIGGSGCTLVAPDATLIETIPEELKAQTPKNMIKQDGVEQYQESELDRALQRLVDDLELAVLGAPTSDVNDINGPGGTHLVQPGEYLDLIIEKTLPDSPIREDLLRKAFVRLNPGAFGGNGNPNYLFAKQKLKIPSVDDLREIIFKAGLMDEVKQQSRNPHQGWIQYP